MYVILNFNKYSVYVDLIIDVLCIYKNIEKFIRVFFDVFLLDVFVYCCER